MKTIAPGFTGADTELLQLGLRRAGYYYGAITPLFDEATADALRRFRDAVRLPSGDTADVSVWDALSPWLLGYLARRIEPGESFYTIAKDAGIPIWALITANPSLKADALPAGGMITVPYSFAVVPTDVSFTYDLLRLCIEGLMARYPFLGVQAIGRTAYGRDIYTLRIGSGVRRVMYSASHHANEWITTPLLMSFLENYSAAYASGGVIMGRLARSLFQRTMLFIAPMVNPDGVDLVTGAILEGDPGYSEARAIASAYPEVRFPDGWKANLQGTDPNLNYPAGWEQAKAIKAAQGFTGPAPLNYVGPAPLSAPESRAMARLSKAYDFELTLSYHTQGQVIYWLFEDYMPANSRQYGELFSQLSGYPLEDTPSESAYAGYKDWFIQEFDRPGYTFEAGLGENPLPIAQLPEIYGQNAPVLAAALAL